VNGAYYNEHDAFAASWLRGLIARGLIAPGHVDERDVRLVQPEDLRGFDQCHFFAGIGGWSYALRLAGWADARPVWTGSCPCQPFSSAGKGEGFADSRHLWPAWFRLIRECKPPVVFGEQVASKDGVAWLDHVATDLETVPYAFGAADLPAAGVRAPHIRQRLWFVADSGGSRVRDCRFGADSGAASEGLRHTEPERDDAACRLANTERERAESGLGVTATATSEEVGGRNPSASDSGRNGGAGLGLEHATGRRRQEPQERDGEQEPHSTDRNPSGPDAHGSNPWAEVVWLPCRDGKLRPTKPGLFPLAARIPGRVGLLRGAGNAIVPHAAAEFIRAYEEAVTA
jgi:DNA (cytosine-5)-methyltransferase 1